MRISPILLAAGVTAAGLIGYGLDLPVDGVAISPIAVWKSLSTECDSTGFDGPGKVKLPPKLAGGLGGALIGSPFAIGIARIDRTQVCQRDVIDSLKTVGLGT